MSAYNRYKKASPEERAAFPEKERLQFEAKIEREISKQKENDAYRDKIQKEMEDRKEFERWQIAKAWAEGFPRDYLPVIYGIGTPNQNIAEGQCRLVIPGNPYEQTCTYIGFPALPLKGTGVFYEGEGSYGESVYWTIDAKNQVWMGSSNWMELSTDGNLRSMVWGDFEMLSTVHRLLGRKPPLKPWVKEAIKEGWTMPPGFDLADFDDGSGDYVLLNPEKS